MKRPARAKGFLNRPIRVGRWALGIAATVLLSSFVGAAAERQGWFDFGTRPSIATQLDVIRQRAAANSYGLVASKRIDLHGSGRTSFVVVFRALKLLSRRGYGPPSDELRIYDVDDHGELGLKFRFRPQASADNRPWLFRLDSIGDLDQNGRPEIIGAWEELAMEPIWPRPVVVAWNDADGGYQMDPILGASKPNSYGWDKPILRRPEPPGGFADYVREVYVKPTILRNTYGLDTIAAYGTEDFVVERVGFGAMMAAIFITRGGAHFQARADQVLIWSVDLQLPTPQVLSCSDPTRPLIVQAAYPLNDWLRLYLKRHREAVRFCG